MQRLTTILALLLILLWPSGAQADQERRVALVVGMGGYQAAPHLPNPPNDADALARTLGRLGFDVDTRIDADYRTLAKALREFGIKAQDADIAVVFYAGHGMQVNRENYLIPVDARLEREHDLVYEALDLDLVLKEASQARKLGIVILDACRNNPFINRMTRSMVATRAEPAQGLARVDSPPKDVLVAMATRADAVAEDGEGKHSPYTAALLEHLEAPGIELGLYFRKVRDTVLKNTRGRQEPYTFGSLGAEAFYFHPLPPNHPPLVPVLAPLEVSDRGGAVPLKIAGFSDPDSDPLTTRITGLPKGGVVKMDDRAVLIGDTLTPEQLAKTTFTPDGQFSGNAGPLTFAVEDGHGASVIGSLFLKVIPSNRPPLAENERTVQLLPAALGIKPPEDPDNDALRITATALPRHGVVRRADGTPVKSGDILDAATLSGLTYDSGAAPLGEAGLFSYVVEDGRGGKAEGKVHLTVVGAPPTSQPPVAAIQLGAEPGARLASTADARPEPAPPSAADSPPRQPAAAAVPSPSPARAKPAAPGIKTIQDCEQCPILVVIAAGAFTMGAESGDPSAQPAHKVTIAKPFALGQHEVTVAEWSACVDAGGCKEMPEMTGVNDRTPVHNIHWNDAMQYVGWLGKQTSKPYRLPSEAEWEYAARAGTGTAYWWGAQAGAGHANCEDCGGEYNRKTPADVETFAPNGFGLYDMAGGIAEWVADCWFASYAGAPKDGSARDRKSCHSRVLRGGAWLNDHTYATTTSRLSYDPDVRYLANGFRVARNVE